MSPKPKTIDYEVMDLKLLLKLHAFASLYGWNLCGLAVISRAGHFPIRLNTGLLILVHWITVILFDPLGNYHPIFALLAILGFAFITYVILFSPTGSAVIRQSDGSTFDTSRWSVIRQSEGSTFDPSRWPAMSPTLKPVPTAPDGRSHPSRRGLFPVVRL
jgi:hypothetical protein